MRRSPDETYMRMALRLAQRGLGSTSPNPMVGAVLVSQGNIIGQGWHHRAGQPHAEIEALRDASKKGHSPAGADLYVTLEPCSTQGRTPPCTRALIEAGLKRVIVGATDPNPAHSGRAFPILAQAGIQVASGLLEKEAVRLNEAFNHWIIHKTPWVTLKSAMTLDGKIASHSGASRWITHPLSRNFSMRLRFAHDAILVGINTALADDPFLTRRRLKGLRFPDGPPLLRIVLDSKARLPLQAHILAKDPHARTLVVVSAEAAPEDRCRRLEDLVEVLRTPEKEGSLDLSWLLRQLGSRGVTSLLVEGGGEANASFLEQGLVHGVAFFYAPKILGGASAPKGVAGRGLPQPLSLSECHWRRIGPDLLLTARLDQACSSCPPARS